MRYVLGLLVGLATLFFGLGRSEAACQAPGEYRDRAGQYRILDPQGDGLRCLKV
jgi:hypothetical protein